MASKGKKQGLGEPENVGVDNLFGGEEVVQTISEQPAEREAPVETKPEVVSQSDEKVKTSISLTQQTVDLLYDLKYAARKQEGKFVSQSELIERALRELAAKMHVQIGS